MSATERAVAARRKGGEAGRIATAALFFGPSLVGFLAFTLVPLVVSLTMSFTDWDLRRHNMFVHEQPIRFIGLDNFARLFHDAVFWRDARNTLFLMLGIPFSVAGSLGLALLLSKDLGGKGEGEKSQGKAASLAVARGIVVSVAAVAALLAVGLGGSGAVMLVGLLAGGILLGGLIGGSTLYRTLFYLPSFTSGVATILLWKNLLNPTFGPVNAVLWPALRMLEGWVRGSPAILWSGLGWAAAGLGLVPLVWFARRVRRGWRDGEIGTGAIGGAALAVGVACGAASASLLGIGYVLHELPRLAAAGLHPPGWHTSPGWAKPAIMVITLWAAVGSGNMLLYLAGLSGIPRELYEAADLDGASPSQRFWNVTWPQLAPTTFFIVILSVINGLQGGFEIARTLTKGGPDGASTTLSYLVYVEGFETGRLGYASAIAWGMFLIIVGVTVFNWKFGGKYVND